MEHFTSPPIDLPPNVTSGSFRRADLVFYGVEHRLSSYVANVFLDVPGATPDTSADREDGYAGFFAIFGHGGCVGDEGHCDPPGASDPFDTRAPHGLRPQTKIVEITDALKRHGSGPLVATVVAVVSSADGPRKRDLLRFSQLRLLTYV
jgi:hypothetical protein